MLLLTLCALFALTCQAIVSVSTASLGASREEHQYKHRHNHGGHGKHIDRRHDVIIYDALANLLKAALKIDREEAADNDDGFTGKAKKQSRRNRSLDNGVIEQQTCQHEDLITCEDYTTGEKECRKTATGMNCCRCKGHLLRRR